MHTTHTHTHTRGEKLLWHGKRKGEASGVNFLKREIRSRAISATPPVASVYSEAVKNDLRQSPSITARSACTDRVFEKLPEQSNFLVFPHTRKVK